MNFNDICCSQARKALDETAREKAKWEIEAERYKSANKETEAKFSSQEAEVERLDRANKALENQVADTKRKYEDSNLERGRLAEELRSLKPEHDKLKKKLADAQRNLEDETLKRIDLQNQLQTSQEEAKFENHMLEQQLNETRTRKQIEIEEIDGQYQHKYEEKLQSSLQELRDAYEKQMVEKRAGFGAVYDKKITDLQNTRLTFSSDGGRGPGHREKEVDGGNGGVQWGQRHHHLHPARRFTH